MKKKEKTWCAITKAEYKHLFYQAHKATTLDIPKHKWNDKKKVMCAVLGDNSLKLQTKIELHPGSSRVYKETTPTEMVTYITTKYRRPRGEFEPGKCKTCQRPGLWVTKPGVKGGRMLVEEVKNTLFQDARKDQTVDPKRTSSIKPILRTTYMRHDDLHPKCREAYLKQQGRK
jgi:hypothetical protein